MTESFLGIKKKETIKIKIINLIMNIYGEKNFYKNLYQVIIYYLNIMIKMEIIKLS